MLKSVAIEKTEIVQSHGYSMRTRKCQNTNYTIIEFYLQSYLNPHRSTTATSYLGHKP